MILKIYKPTTPSKRHYLDIIFQYDSKTPILKSKLKKQKRISGRNNTGKITIFNRGRSHKKRYRVLLNINSLSHKGIVYAIEYDPNRNCSIAAVYNPQSNLFFYTIAANKLKKGDFLRIGVEASEKLGHSLKLNDISIGCPIFNVNSTISRSAGTFAVLVSKTKNKAKLLLSSGKKKTVFLDYYAIIGTTSNELIFLKQLGKAGKSRWLGFKSKVKGIAMNPVDHPNGGGEGKKSSKRKSPWGKILKSKK